MAVTVAASEGAVAGKLAVGKKAEANGANGFGVPSEGDSAPLHVPFGAVALQQLANAALTSKKVSNDESWDSKKPAALHASMQQGRFLVLLASLVHSSFCRGF